MMKVKLLFCSNFILSLILFAFSNPIFAKSYTKCSENELTQLIEQLNLQKKDSFVDDKHFFADCIHLDIQQPLKLVAISHPLEIVSDNAGNYDLNLFLINQQQKIISQYKHKDLIIPETRFEKLTFDINSYSSLPNENIIGLAQKQQHIGGVSHDARYLNLYRINKSLEIKPILRNFLTDFNSGMAPMGCDDAQTSTLKRHLILLSTISNGLQDIKINEKTEDSIVDKSCKVHKPIHQQQHIFKFNGTEYPTNQIKFLKYGL